MPRRELGLAEKLIPFCVRGGKGDNAKGGRLTCFKALATSTPLKPNFRLEMNCKI